MKSAIRKFVTAPWLVFLVLGGLAYGLYPEDEPRPLIHVTRGQLDTYLESYLRQFPRQYTPELEQRLIEQLIAEEALLQRALALDYQYLPVVQDRLKKLGSFLQEEGDEQLSDEQLVERAIELGLLESDPVIRRYLVSVMERALVAPLPIEITREEIQTYYQQHTEDFVRPARMDITHVFFSEDAGRSRDYAAAIRDELIDAGQQELDQVLRRGDVFYSGHQFAGKNEAQLAAIFGAEFAREAFRQGVGQWSPPLRSAYGWHLIWPENRLSPVTPPVGEVEEKIVARIRQEKEKQLLVEQVEKLKQHYQIIVESGDEPGAQS